MKNQISRRVNGTNPIKLDPDRHALEGLFDKPPTKAWRDVLDSVPEDGALEFRYPRRKGDWRVGDCDPDGAQMRFPYKDRWYVLEKL